MSAITAELGLEAVRLEMSPGVHEQFRAEAARDLSSIAAMARSRVEEWTAVRQAGRK
jgi:hypothetical protein